MRILYLFPITLWGTLFTASCGESHKPQPPAPPSVRTAVLTVQYETVPSTIEAPGSVKPHDRVVLSSQINGFVRDVLVHAGDTVAAGQTLATLDSREAESQKSAAAAAIEEARASLEEARKSAQAAASMRAAAKAASELANTTLARYQKLFDSHSVSPQELDEIRARRDAAAADLASKETLAAAAEDCVRQVNARLEQAGALDRRADVQMGWTVVKAPALGKIVERNVDPGSAIFPGSPLLVLESTTRPQVLAEIPTAQAANLRLGQEVNISSRENPVAAIRGRVAEIVPLSNPSTHSVQFKLDLPQNFSALSGDYVTVGIPVGTRRVLLVPRQAVRETGQLTGVFVASSASKAQLRLVKISPYDATRFELLSGVEPGEQVVAAPDDQIVDGTPLEIRR